MKNNSMTLFGGGRRSRLFLLLCLTTCFNFLLLGYRLYLIDYDFSHLNSVQDIAHSRGIPTFLFLVWNLFLAWIPYWIAITLNKLPNYKAIYIPVLMIWLLFLPNAPYIITDLLHLKHRMPIPIWYDVMMIFSFAWTGLLLGFASLMEVQRFLKNKVAQTWINVFTTAVIILCGFGVYLGRFQRWNTWDVLTNPLGLAIEILEVLAHPFAYAETLGMAVIMTTLLGLGYLTLQTLVETED